MVFWPIWLEGKENFLFWPVADLRISLLWRLKVSNPYDLCSPPPKKQRLIYATVGNSGFVRWRGGLETVIGPAQGQTLQRGFTSTSIFRAANQNLFPKFKIIIPSPKDKPQFSKSCMFFKSCIRLCGSYTDYNSSNTFLWIRCRWSYFRVTRLHIE